ncbi:hypothetical protein DFH06DRAFT_1256344 [Mycena polygramma]|nr:hypothetical protein DFH06DRAFT_1256344 [Mycena polygramma]
MVASSGVAASPQPAFPEDIERHINEVLLKRTPNMCGIMSLVTSRFNTWTKPIAFHTVVIRPQHKWMQRIRDSLLPNASFIRILVLDLPFTQDQTRIQPSEEFSFIRRLLEVSGRVKHLAVTWNIWTLLKRECGALRLESLYLMWDGALNIEGPSLRNLGHPSTLEDLAVYAPPSIWRSRPPKKYGMDLLPATTQCGNLAYVTYVSDRRPAAGMEWLEVKGIMLVILCTTGSYWQRDSEERWITTTRAECPHLSTACMRSPDEVLGEWVSKMEGRESVLNRG